MSCNGLKIQTEVPKMPLEDLICPGRALKVDIAVCLLVCVDIRDLNLNQQ
jgi:hypothetical protein